MDLGIAGRVAVVTGASKGIGRAAATLLAAEGAAVVLSARGPDALNQAVEELRAGGYRAVGVAGDISDPATTTAIVNTADETFGPVDIVVNNAGGQIGHLPIERLTDADWEHAYQLNVISAVRLTVAALPPMRRRRWGRIVNVASYTARVPEPFCGPYAAAKAALVNVTPQPVAQLRGRRHLCQLRAARADRHRRRPGRLRRGGCGRRAAHRPAGAPDARPGAYRRRSDGHRGRGGRGHRLPVLGAGLVDHRRGPGGRRGHHPHGRVSGQRAGRTEPTRGPARTA